MRQATRNKIINIFKDQSGYACTGDITKQGIHHVHLKALLEDGTIIKIKHGLFSLSDNNQFDAFLEAKLSIPDGVICLGTALSWYGLTTWDPPEIHIAIPKGRKIKLPEYPPVKLFYFSGNFYNYGIADEEIESGDVIKIYDREKTICDIVRYRNKIGIDIMKESLREYLKSNEINLNKLHKYSVSLKISSVLRQYLDVLI